MLTYVPSSDRAAAVSPPQNEKPWLLLLLCVFWLLPGLWGHDPWKPVENQSVAIIAQLLRGADWSVPLVAGVPYLEHAPLYYWCAALFAQPLAWLGMPLHDAARLSTGVWMALAMWGVGLAGRELHGRRQGRVAVVVLIGSIGLLLWGHHVSPAAATFAAFAWQLYALALARRRPLQAGGLLGLAWLVLLLGSTWSEALLAMAAALLLVPFSAWRKSGYLAALLAAFAIALPLGLLWPLSLYKQAPEAFTLWWDYQSLGLYGGIAHFRLFHEPGYLPSIIVWFAFPCLPLAAWSLWFYRQSLRQSRWVLLIVQSVLVALWLFFAGEPGESQALLLLVPLAVLAAAGVDDLRHSAASSLYWFGITTLGVLAVALWGLWLAMQLGWPAEISSALHRRSPTYIPVLGLGAFFAAGISVAWVRVLLGKRTLGRRAVTAWACGLTLVWGLLVSLWQPWLDASKTYREVGLGLRMAAKDYPGCIYAPQSGVASLGGLSYFSGLDLRGSGAPGVEQCPLQLLQGQPADGQRRLLWMGSRSGESGERFFLYAKQ
ncbi:MAG: hypothetical protein H6R07_1915 [Proteobacteria bacterium]|nr:hypothetical protein [Pseudomonadota bacterium]